MLRNQNKTTTIRDTLHFESTTYRELHGRGNNTASFAEHLKFPERLAFAYAVWINCSQLKLKNQNQDNVHFEIAAYRVLQERNNKTASFTGHLKLQE